jgi:heme A synthase
LGLAIVGFVLLLFALEQAFDIELFDALEDALATETGRWLAVAFLALLLIGVALGGWRYRRPPA